jgi:hypothetical protein
MLALRRNPPTDLCKASKYGDKILSRHKTLEDR